MPIENGVGYGDHTQQKQDDFQGLLSLHISVVDGITSKPGKAWQRYYNYIDMNAGPGNQNGIVGSPILFLNRIEQTTIHYQATFIEREQCNAEKLQQLISVRSWHGGIKVVNNDHAMALRNGASPQKSTYGMIYHDPSGSVPDFTLLAELSTRPEFKFIDFVVYLSATNIKRVRRFEQVTGRDAKVKLLTDYLRSINKSTWIIRKPVGRHQWTFAIGSNWVSFPEWKKRGFYQIDTPEGKSMLERLTYTDGELDDMSGQMSFFNQPVPMIDPTETIKIT